MNNIDILEEFLGLRELISYDSKSSYLKIYQNAVETLIVENKELKEENFNLKQQKIIDKCSIPSQDNFYDYYNYIEKSKVEEIIEELRNDTCKIINRTYIPTISSKLFNNNREKYEPMLEARNILINALNKLQSLLGKE